MLWHVFGIFIFCTIGRSESVASDDTSQTLDLVMFSDAAGDDPLAICNDGTKGGYYFSTAIDEDQSDIFVIYLPGGGQCYDKDSCDSRADDMMSSKWFPSSQRVTGFLDSSPSKTPLWGANKAYLGYCSSDGYMGDAAASDATWGYNFRGQRLVRAMVTALIRDRNLANATRIFMSGSSAGARGMMTQIDLLAETLLPVSAQVIGLLDSPYYLDTVPYSSEFEGFQYQEQQKFLYFNTTAILSDECYNTYAPASDGWKCQFGQFRMPFVKTSYFIIASQYDSYQLGLLTQTEPEFYTEVTTQYAEDFGGMDRHQIRNLSLHSYCQDRDLTQQQQQQQQQQEQAQQQQQRRGTGMEAEAGTIPVVTAIAPAASASASASTSASICATSSTSAVSNAVDAGRNNRNKRNNVDVVSGYGFFAWACYNHAVANTEHFYASSLNNGVSQKDAFEAYLSKLDALPSASDASRLLSGLSSSSSSSSSSLSSRNSSPSVGKRSMVVAAQLAMTHQNHDDNNLKPFTMTWIEGCVTFSCGEKCEISA